jgi:DNA invertase Pin-like site-specific DNA recombinase
MGRKWGYARVSSTDQDLSVQEADLKAAGVDLIFAEKKSGTTTEGREELEKLLTIAGRGDVIYVTRIDRLARSMQDFANMAADLKARGVGLKVIKQNIDTTEPEEGADAVTKATRELTMNLLAAFAQFETALRRERQMEGIAKAKAEGVYKGREPKIDPAKVKELKDGGMGPAAIAKQLGIARCSVYRALQSA